MRRLLATLVALIVAALSLPARADLSRPVYDTRLANGLRVIVSPDPASTDVTVLVRYVVGSRDEPTGKEGIAHLVEHLMFLGSKHAPRGKLAELLDRVGATNVNGETWADGTTYHETLPPEQLELGLWLESDRLGYLLDSVDQAAFTVALHEVYNEYRLRTGDALLGSVPTIEWGELFPSWHPYHHLPGGTPESLGGGLTLADAQAFASTWYGAANAVLVITGKVDPSNAWALAQRYFASLPARPPPARRDVRPEAVDAAAARLLGDLPAPDPAPLPLADPPAPVPPWPRVVYVGAKTEADALVSIVARGPGEGTRDLAALEVLARYFGAFSSPMRGDLRHERGAAYAFGAGVTSYRWASRLEIGASLAPDKALAAIRGMLEMIADVARRGIPPEALAHAQTGLLSGYRARAATVNGASRIGLDALLSPALLDAFAHDQDRILAVTPDDVRRVAALYLSPAALRLVVVGAPSLRPGLEQLGLGPVQARNEWATPVL